VNLLPRKDACERDPFRLLHNLHALVRLSGVMARSG
jgi:hypothetical protein